MDTAGWMDRMKMDLTRRREELLATVSQRALDALEAVERVEGALSKAPDRLRDWRIKAADRLETYARRKGVGEEPLRAEVDTVDIEVEVRSPEPYDLPHRPARDQARGDAPAQRPEKARAAGRKTVQSATSPRRGAPGRKKKPSGFVVKRGQKHRHDR